MPIYQVVDKENNLVNKYAYQDVAYHSAEDMTVWYADHYYHVEKLVFCKTGEAYS